MNYILSLTSLLKLDLIQFVNVGFLVALAFLILVFVLYIAKIRQFITEKQAKDSALAEVKILSSTGSYLEAVLQNIEDGVIIADISGQIKYSSKKALDILKTNISILQDRHITEILPVENSSGKIISNQKSEVKLQNGTTVVLIIDALPIVGQGFVRGAIYIIHDVTKEKEFEEMKFDFVAMAAHQLRTPLTTLRGYLLALSDMVMGKLNDEEQMYLKGSITGANQLSSLIENLLYASSIGGKLVLRLNNSSVEKIIDDVVKNMFVLADRKGVNLIFEKPKESLPKIMFDPFLITEVLNNLIMNAIEHTNKGGEIVAYITQTDKELIVNIKDSGEGIPYYATPYLFTKFYKVPSDLAMKSKGSGLGLYISKSIVEAHKGKIWVNSVLGRGSVFSFSLPLHQTAQNQESTTQNTLAQNVEIPTAN